MGCSIQFNSIQFNSVQFSSVRIGLVWVGLHPLTLCRASVGRIARAQRNLSKWIETRLRAGEGLLVVVEREFACWFGLWLQRIGRWFWFRLRLAREPDN